VARGDSIIRVSIIGDASKLLGAVKDADKATGGLLKSAGKVVVGGLLAGKAIDTVFDIANDSLAKADDFNDHLDTLSKLTTPEFARRLHDTAFGMADIGLSAGDVAAAATAFASFATSAGASKPAIEAAIPGLLDVAEAIHAKTGKTVAEVIDDIGKGVAGSAKGLKDYGISVDTALNPDERILSILSQAKTLFGDAKSAADDLHGTQDKINANVDNFKIKLGEALEGPLNDIAKAGLEILDELKDWPGAIGQIGDAFGKLLSPLARIRDIVQDVFDLEAHTQQFVVSPGRTPRNSDIATRQAVDRDRARNGLPSLLGGP